MISTQVIGKVTEAGADNQGIGKETAESDPYSGGCQCSRGAYVEVHWSRGRSRVQR